LKKCDIADLHGAASAMELICTAAKRNVILSVHILEEKKLPRVYYLEISEKGRVTGKDELLELPLSALYDNRAPCCAGNLFLPEMHCFYCARGTESIPWPRDFAA
jgi:hypothetical protein